VSRRARRRRRAQGPGPGPGPGRAGAWPGGAQGVLHGQRAPGHAGRPMGPPGRRGDSPTRPCPPARNPPLLPPSPHSESRSARSTAQCGGRSSQCCSSSRSSTSCATDGPGWRLEGAGGGAQQRARPRLDTALRMPTIRPSARSGRARLPAAAKPGVINRGAPRDTQLIDLFDHAFRASRACSHIPRPHARLRAPPPPRPLRARRRAPRRERPGAPVILGRRAPLGRGAAAGGRSRRRGGPGGPTAAAQLPGHCLVRARRARRAQ
jgi:hypothetical protein